MELPLSDLELIHALQIAPRANWKQLGEILDTHPSTLAARWDRLHASGQAWVTGHRGVSAVEGTLAFIGVQCVPEQRLQVLERLCAIAEFSTVEEGARSWDYRLTVFASHWYRVTRELLPMLRRDPGIVRTHLIVVTRSIVLGHNWRLDVLGAEQQRRLAALHPQVSREPGKVPYLEEMLPVLARDGRASTVQLAQAAGTHSTTVARYLKLGLETGQLVLRCESAQEYSGYPVACQWYARVPTGELAAATEYLRSFRTLRLCAVTTGEANLTFYLWLRHVADIEKVEWGLQQAVPGARILESEVGVRNYKRMGWMLNEDTTCTGQLIIPELPEQA